MQSIFFGNLEPSTTIAGCVDIFENVWPDPLSTIEICEQQSSDPYNGMQWLRASTMGDGINQNYRTNYNMGISAAADSPGNRVAKDVHNQMFFLLMAAVPGYASRYEIGEPLNHEPYNLLRYEAGEEYKPHCDGSYLNGRSVSAIVYLNNDYDGGELEFVNFKVKIKPEPGMLILFPSNYSYKHIAHPVTDGTKYAIVTWLGGAREFSY